MKSLTALICFLLLSSATEIVPDASRQVNYFDASIGNRTAAEWEPALGTLVVWPLSIPHTLAIELAKDNHLYTMLEDEQAKAEASDWFDKWGIDSTHVTFIYAAQGIDAWWTRDWGPSAVFTPDGQFSLADGKYLYATPSTDLACNDSLRFQSFDGVDTKELTQIDDDATIPLANQLGYALMDLPFNNTGGNVLTDGLGTAFSSCVIKSENRYHGVDFGAFLKLNESLLGFNHYNIISNFEPMGIQHVDCFMKVIDEETLLVAQPPKDHELYDVYEDIVKDELMKLSTHYGRPYTIKRIQTGRYEKESLAAYTNSLILNKTVYVPLFNINEDSTALKTWEEVMPGYKVKGFTYFLDDEPIVEDDVRTHYKAYGWNDGDALHCRTRAIWNPEMLFISVKKIAAEVDLGQKTTVYATIIDYSGKELQVDKLNVKWRIRGMRNWNTEVLKAGESPDGYFATVPSQRSEATIEYYIEAASESGAIAQRPMTAPKGFFTFNYVAKD
jgi:agmatine/peptidylarginine deiminase